MVSKRKAVDIGINRQNFSPVVLAHYLLAQYFPRAVLFVFDDRNQGQTKVQLIQSFLSRVKLRLPAINHNQIWQPPFPMRKTSPQNFRQVAGIVTLVGAPTAQFEKSIFTFI